MNKSYQYTLITLLLAAVFVIGSMAGMDFILRVREKKILSASGTAAMVSPVRAWQQWEAQVAGETEKQAGSDGYVLNFRQIEEVIRSRTNYDEEVIHEPVGGQISIEKAIEAGKKWIAEMAVEERNGRKLDEEIYFVNAILGIRKHKEASNAQMEPYYSFWTVRFSSESMGIVLYINAITGKVWNAEIGLYDTMLDEVPYENLSCFSELAGFKVSDEPSVEMKDGRKRANLAIEDSLLYTQMECYEVNVDKNGIVDYSETGKFRDRYLVITYDLLLKEN